MEMKEDGPATKGDIRRLALEIVKTNGRIDDSSRITREEIRSASSRMIERLEEFMTRVGTVDRAQIIADWRVTELEKRGKALEAR